MGAAISFHKSYVVSNSKPTLLPAIWHKHWPVWACDILQNFGSQGITIIKILILGVYNFEFIKLVKRFSEKLTLTQKSCSRFNLDRLKISHKFQNVAFL